MALIEWTLLALWKDECDGVGPQEVGPGLPVQELNFGISVY